MLKTKIVLYQDNPAQFADIQPELQSHILVSSGCDPGTIAVPEQVAFRKQAEVYVKADKETISSEATVQIGDLSQGLLDRQGCVRLGTPSKPFTVPYPEEGQQISITGVRGIHGGKLVFAIPEKFLPWILLRYSDGQMIPTPMRADLLVVDVAERTLELTYRTTFPVKPAMRKIEFRSLLKNMKPWEGETPEAAYERFEHQLQYLKRCPVPSTPPELCSLPEVMPIPAFFSSLRP